MQLSDLLSGNCTKSAVPCSSKKRAIEIISELAAAQLGIDSQELFECLLAREKLGSTGIGGAIAIPHGRIPDELPVTGVLLTLEQPIPFDAIDNQPVDILFALLVPESQCKQHLQTLGLIAKKLSDKNLCRQLRLADNDEMLYQLITAP
ncbi:PTS IIA-like nitrogen regulatory protein PtsN [Pseudaeromonas paramecii]|uniref:PTS IIA-like nitrogen regulatory protein PtsN n=1 Tax=Pseudaeromonas paramecii TaxID=2138166 RepID=A0ABP8Q7J3_9GAMM